MTPTKICFYCFTEYCINLPKFYNLVKDIIFLRFALPKVLRFRKLYCELVMLTENTSSLPSFCSTVKQEEMFIYSNNSHCLT